MGTTHIKGMIPYIYAVRAGNTQFLTGKLHYLGIGLIRTDFLRDDNALEKRSKTQV